MYSTYTKDNVIKFYNTYGRAIVENITDTGLFFPAVIGQITMESTFGNNAPGNNFAGIKATGSIHSNGTQLLDTAEYIGGQRKTVKQSFATYADFPSFMKDYVRVLKLDRYVNAGVYTAATPEDQVLAIAKAGYATADPQRYLSDCRGRIEAARDVYKFGKISSKVTAPTQAAASAAGVEEGGYLGSVLSSIGNSISSVLNKPIGK